MAKTKQAIGMRTGARILVDQLRIHGVDTIFCVPGESYLAVLDALYDEKSIDLVTCRQEGGAAMAADAYGKMTGRPGICMVTRGPGATNASSGLHVARQDSTPLILFIGQVARGMMEREAFQEIDYRRMLGQVAKWVAEIDDPSRIPEFLSRAFHVATSGRPGPVVLSLPEDMQVEEAQVADVKPYQILESWPGDAPLASMHRELAAAKRPLMLLGGSIWDAKAAKHIQAFAAANQLPVACVFRRQDHFNNAHRCYVGDVGIGINPKLAQRVKDADLLLVVGARLGEVTTSGYKLLDIPTPRQRLIHVYPEPDEIGRVYRPDLGIASSPREFVYALADIAPVKNPVWVDWMKQARSDYLTNIKPPLNTPGKLQMGAVMSWLEENTPADAIFTNGAGNFSTWLHRFHQYRMFGTQLAPTSGSMGYGFPAAMAAKIVHPERMVICFAGDGDFLMTGQELATAVARKLNVIVLLLNNGIYGTIRMHQENHFPGRVIGTDLHNPDFVALARAYGGFGEIVERTKDFAGAFKRAQTFDGPAILEMRVDPEAITPRFSLSELRANALAKKA